MSKLLRQEVGALEGEELREVTQLIEGRPGFMPDDSGELQLDMDELEDVSVNLLLDAIATLKVSFTLGDACCSILHTSPLTLT